MLTSPALLFWLGGLLAWVWAHGGFTGPASGWQALQRAWTRALAGTTSLAQALLAVLALLLVLGASRIAETCTPAVLRLLEGYWPRWARPLRSTLVAVRGFFIGRRAERWRALARRRAQLTPAERAEYAALNTRRALVPAVPEERMPTGLGDVLKAAESRPRHRYGLDSVVCWPALWLTMPDHARVEVAAARERLDEGARLWLWSVLFAVWAVFTWWALVVAPAGMAAGYRLAAAGSVSYGQLVDACFDLYRDELYRGVGWEPPSGPAGEQAAGRRLTTYLERGAVPLSEPVRTPVPPPVTGSPPRDGDPS
ncbi:hypothetical protein ACF1B0_35415 [Streptomyces anandii]|uniref:hypothetical protein n=1 Tax=Streptomyces anandii TaxID=285454 RepID=UPI0037014C5A